MVPARSSLHGTANATIITSRPYLSKPSRTDDVNAHVYILALMFAAPLWHPFLPDSKTVWAHRIRLLNLSRSGSMALQPLAQAALATGAKVLHHVATSRRIRPFHAPGLCAVYKMARGKETATYRFKRPHESSATTAANARRTGAGSAAFATSARGSQI